MPEAAEPTIQETEQKAEAEVSQEHLEQLNSLKASIDAARRSKRESDAKTKQARAELAELKQSNDDI